MIELDPALAGVVRIAAIRAAPVRPGPADPALRAAIASAAADARRAHGGATPGDIAGLAAARRLYRSFGIDPTKTRPSSEALLRRILRGGEIPAILGPVDVSNLLAVRFLLPNGLYDAELVEGHVRIRRGAPGESYPGIRKGDVHLEGRPVVADDRGPFGNPTSDSARTAVSARTRRLLMVVFAPGDYEPDLLRGHLAEARATIATHLAPAGFAVATQGELLGIDQ